MTRYPGAVRLCTAVLLFFFAALPAERGGLTAVVTAAATLAALTLLCHALSVLPAGHPVPPGRVRTALRDRTRTRVIFISGYAEDVFAEGHSPVPNSAFLAKPFSLSDLTAMVGRQLALESTDQSVS